MTKKQEKLDFWVDDLTNSIRNRISGDSFQTEVSRLKKNDLKTSLRRPDGILAGAQNWQITLEKFSN